MIGTNSYKFVSDALGESQRLGFDALEPLVCMRDIVLNTDISKSERYTRNLLNMISATYSHIALKHANLDDSMRDAVTALNQHVLTLYGDLYGYSNLDEFLEDQYIELDPMYAAISRYLGFPVTIEGTKAARWRDIDDSWKDVDITWSRLGWSNY